MHIAALLSGGVDSASALCRYIEQNPKYKKHIHAYYLKIWLEDELSFLGECPWEEDIYFAQKTADQLDIPLHIIPLQREYHDEVVSYTLEELKQGGTPSPDVFCNEKIKFGAFLKHVDSDLTISGHYAQIKHFPRKEEVQLHCAPDKIKDQTYFLSHMHQSQLQKIIFPIGDLTKQEVRNFAHTKNLAPKDRKDSQGICFLGKIKYRDFVLYHLGEKEGPIIDIKTNKTLGTHSGAWLYTIGQRSGLGLSGGPWHVTDKSVEQNIVWVQHSNKIIKNTSLAVENIHWINTSFPNKKIKPHKNFTTDIQVKLRHGPQLINATIKYKAEEKTAKITLAFGDAGIAPGQIAVFYDNFQCLGSSRILKGF